MWPASRTWVHEQRLLCFSIELLNLCFGQAEVVDADLVDQAVPEAIGHLAVLTDQDGLSSAPIGPQAS